MWLEKNSYINLYRQIGYKRIIHITQNLRIFHHHLSNYAKEIAIKCDFQDFISNISLSHRNIFIMIIIVNFIIRIFMFAS